MKIIHNQNMISAKIVSTNFCEKLQKLSFMLFSKFQMMKYVFEIIIKGRFFENF